jgi:hypothetical protein
LFGPIDHDKHSLRDFLGKLEIRGKRDDEMNRTVPSRGLSKLLPDPMFTARRLGPIWP